MIHAIFKFPGSFWLSFWNSLVAGALVLFWSGTAEAQEQSGRTSKKGSKAGAITESSDEIANILSDVRGTKGKVFFFQPLRSSLKEWGHFWHVVDEKSGLSMGFAYTTLYQAATSGDYLGPRDGGSGDLDILGRWEFFHTDVHEGFINKGTMGFSGEYRHQIGGATTPSELGDSLGSLWGTTSGFNEKDLSLVQWWWQQLLMDEHLWFRIGIIDLSDIFDVYRFNSANFFFLNAAFSDNPAIPFPDVGLGGVIRWDPGHDVFAIVGWGDVEGRKTGTVRSSLNKSDAWFSAMTLGWNPKVGDMGKGLYQVTGWHSDQQHDSDIPSAAGFSIILQQDLGNGWTPFTRYAYSDDAVVDTRQIVTGGVVYKGNGKREEDRMGVALAWGEPHNPDYRNQWTAELFYRWAATPEFQITPLAQIIYHPSKNPNDQVIGLFGLRARLSF